MTKSQLIGMISSVLLITGSHLDAKCNSGDTINIRDINELCRRFVKAICTKDSAVFYSSIDKDSLCSYLNQKYPNEKSIKPELVWLPYFYNFSPWVIRNDKLMALREKKEYFETFMAEIVKQYGDSRVGIDISWKESFPEAKAKHIYVLVRKNGDLWKVIGADW